MATKSITLRALLESINDVGDSPSCDFDEAVVLSGWTSDTHKHMSLPASAADLSLGLAADAAMVFIYSHDYPFSVRLKAAEKLIGPVRFFAFAADDEAAVAYDAGPDAILLTGNGSNAADLEVFIIETA